MPSSNRVRVDDEGISHGDYLIRRVAGGHWRVYEDATEYTGVSGLTVIRGPVMRDVDGSIFRFDTQAEAEAWVDQGCPVSL